MFRKLVSTMVLVFSFTSLSAHADLLLEPYLGYHTGEWESGSTSKDMKGVTYGGRIGYQGMGLMVGADYMLGTWEDESNPKNDVKPADLGIFVGYNLPLVRFYGVISPAPLNPELKFKNGNSSTKYTGSTMKFGVGFTALPMVSINVEYLMGTYDEADGQDLTTDLKTKMLGLTVSLPLTF